MAKLSDFRVDSSKEQDGVWVPVGDDLELLIAGAENPEYRRCREKLLKPHLRKLRAKRMTTEELEDVTKQAMARHILLGWKNLEDDDGNAIPYSHAKALEILRESRELFSLVADFASEQALFREEDAEDAEKN